MRDDNDVRVWKIVATSVCVLIVSMGGCGSIINIQDNNAMIKMVADGADPLDAKCAVKGYGTLPCLIRAATKNK